MFEMGALRKDFIGVVIVKVFGACMTILLSIYITRYIGKGAFGLISLAN
jgi:O-antigen/teichoic acid export membrane protein